MSDEHTLDEHTLVGLQQAVHPVYGPITNTVTFHAQPDGEPLLVLTPTGFWVRGVKVEQDEHEAQRVYQAVREWDFGVGGR